MSVEVGYVRVTKEPQDQRLNLAAFRQVRVQHFSCFIEGPKRDHPQSHDLWHFANELGRSVCPLTNENGVACSVRRVCGLVGIV
jgi:hypothetical protein